MLTGEPSRTARAVAAVRNRATRVPAPYGDPAAAERLEHGVADDLPVGDTPMSTYLTVRTAFFDRLVVDAIDAGVRQIVTAAAGYDTRAIRYGKPGVKWFEVDHPSTQTDKKVRVAALDVDAPDLTFVAADFTVDDVAERLVEAGCDPTVESLVLAEGIAVYLSVEVLAELLSGLRRSVATGSRLGISLSLTADTPEQQERRAAFQERVATLGEPARSVLTVADSAGLMTAAGWQLEGHPLAADGAPGRTGFVTALAIG